jgi:hypothetical protein
MDFTGRPMRGFVYVNSEGIATESALGEWLDLALEFNPRAKASKRGSSSPRKARVGASEALRQGSR